MNAKKAREMFANGELTTGDAVEAALGMIADLQDQIAELETRAIRRLEMVEEAVFSPASAVEAAAQAVKYDKAVEILRALRQELNAADLMFLREYGKQVSAAINLLTP
jgi:hypothetical protein